MADNFNVLDHGAIGELLVDAKGDLLTATADNTPARLAVGTNGKALVADSTQSTGLKWSTGIRRWVTPHFNGIATTSQTFTAGRVLLCMFDLPFGGTIDAVSYVVGTNSAGNVTVGIYGPLATLTTDTCAGAAVLVQSASTAQGTGSTAQLVTFTATAAGPGIYFAALEGSDATGTYMRLTNQTQVPVTTGWNELYDRGGGYGTLTDPCPAVTQTVSNMPGLRVRISA
jgi:hypothetical protein